MTNAQVIDGRALARTLINELKDQFNKATHPRSPGLATVLVGENRASTIYVSNKRKTAKKIGIRSIHHHLPTDTEQSQLLALIDELNATPDVDGILVQLPLPPHINEQAVIERIDAKKDVDGFHPLNLGYLLSGRPRVVACTPLGIMHMIKSVGYSLIGKHAVVVGRSNIVGKPIAQLLLQAHATVTMCHSQTAQLKKITQQADLLVAAVGRPRFIDRSYIKPGAFIIDVGINKDGHDKLCGDVNFDDVLPIASYITPVPGGVGPLTIAMLMKNTVQNYLAAN